MLLTLIERINGMQRNEELSWDMDSDVNWSSWIDTDLPEDVTIWKTLTIFFDRKLEKKFNHDHFN